MRCSGCNHNVARKGLTDGDLRCPNCGHRFTADPKKDPVSDVTIKKAIERVSDGGTLFYLPAHVGYELLRRLNARPRRTIFKLLLSAAIFAAVVIFWKSLHFFAVFVAVVIALSIAASAFGSRKSVDLFDLVLRYETDNPPKEQVPSTAQLIESERGKNLAGLRGAARVLVCQHQRDAEFFIANDFHLHHACPVAGPDGKALDGFPELEGRLKRGGALDVFVLHDFTSTGVGYAQRLRAMPGLRGRRDPTTVIEMGFNEPHRPMLKGALRPLNEIPGARGATGGGAWSGDLGAQIAALRPVLMLAAAGKSIEERAPIRATKHDDDHDTSDDSDSGDSE